MPSEDGTNALAATRSVVFNNARTESLGRSGIEEPGPFRHMQGDGLRKLREERGASAVEFAIIASLLLMILFGTITFGILLNRYQGLQSAAREGARLGSLSTTDRPTIVNRVRESVSIIDGANVAASCPANVNSLSIENGCIRIFARSAPSATPVAVGLGDPNPCGTFYAGADKSVLVEVFYRLRIDIPIWASPQMTISGGAEFKCEG